mgnify:CR=1 FL=1
MIDQKKTLWHEVMDRASVLADSWERSLCGHSLLNPCSDSGDYKDEHSIRLYKRASEISDQLWEFYSMAGEISFNLGEGK